MKKSLIALAFGTLALGIAEYVMMAILPYIAEGLDISIPEAGHLISAYALGVCVGAPLLVFARRYPLKHLLLGLSAVMLVGNLLAALAPNYWVMMVARFISGLPHGGYFGVASIVAERVAEKGRGSEAVSIMIAGMTVANLFGVPLGTSLSALLSWRATFLLVAFGSLLVIYYIWKWVPHVEGLSDTGLKGQFRFLKKPAPWLILGGTTFGNGAIFCWYSYINPLLTDVSGFAEESISLLMILAGFGMVVGNLTGGKLADRFSPGRVAFGTHFIVFFALVAIFFTAQINWLSALLMCVCTTGLFTVSGPLQVSILQFSKGGELLGAALIQVAFNLGNALGAYIGGLPIEAGLGYRYPALYAVPISVIGLIMLFWFCRRYERFASSAL